MTRADTPLLPPTPAAPARPMTMISFGQIPIPVVRDGLYHRYGGNTPLDIAAAQPGVIDVDYFRSLRKERLKADVESYNPNFYYHNAMISLTFTADLAALRELLPLAEVEPLATPDGQGVVQVNAYTYKVCDNDAYNEIALGFATTRPALAGDGPENEHWGHVLKLPVDTELARIRGVQLYNLPKWIAEISYDETPEGVRVVLSNAATGAPELTITGRNLSANAAPGGLAVGNLINPGRNGGAVHSRTRINLQKTAASSDADAATVVAGEGVTADLLRRMKLGRLIRYQHTPEMQLALYAAVPLGQSPG